MTPSVFLFKSLPPDPLLLWQVLHKNPRHGFFLGCPTAMPGHQTLYMSAGEPTRVLRGNPIIVMRSIKQKLRRPAPLFVPRFVGIVGFDAARWFDPALARLPQQPDPLNVPAVSFGDYPCVVELNLKKRETKLHCHSAVKMGVRRLCEIIQRACLPKRHFHYLDNSRYAKDDGSNRFEIPSFLHFSSMVKRAKEAIRRGDIYQANLSLRFKREFKGDPIKLYRALCGINPSPYACLMKQDQTWVVSCSPELLMAVKGRRVVTRPIAGTRPRGETPARDRARRGQLLLSPKERAEHIMLVDLERNDVGRVCEPGRVRVTERFAIERYSHVMHIVSQVEGRLRQGRDAIDALAAVFPGGTITGCPKIKSIEIIQELETVSRAIFFGSAGFFAANGDALFNILIRTALVAKGRLILQAGAGIVADSQPRREYAEVLAKARALMEATKRT